jgi:RNA polymerase-binding transcription factor DksA
MPANKKPAPKAPAKPAKKAPAKPAKKAPAKSASKAAKAPAAKKTKPAPAKKAVKAAAQAKKALPVKKAAPAKKAPPPAKKSAPATKPAPAKAPVAKKAPAKAPPAKPAPSAPKQPTAAKKVATKSAPPPAKKSPIPAVKVPVVNRRAPSALEDGITLDSPPKKPVLPAAFLKKAKQRLVELRDVYLNAAEGVTNENLRNADSNESAFGMHQADAGSDAYDRDFALSLLAKEQDAIYEINEALKRIEQGTYGICEMSGELIPEERLEALPFTRFTVGSQARIESEQRGGRWTRPVRSLFGLDESADAEDDEDDEDASDSSSSSKTKQSANESLDFSKE